MLLKLLFCFGITANAHVTGHGETIAGVGPDGGKLAAVVAASDVEKGDEKTGAVVEWKVVDGEFHFTVRNKEMTPVAINGPSTIKYIILGKDKPKVLAIDIPETRGRFTQHFVAKDLENAESIEVILPNLGAKPGKHVFVAKLK